jgi:Mg/Co/Ni transporter MgtE
LLPESPRKDDRAAWIWVTLVLVAAVVGFLIIALQQGVTKAAVVLAPVVPIVAVWFIVRGVTSRRRG